MTTDSICSSFLCRRSYHIVIRSNLKKRSSHILIQSKRIKRCYHILIQSQKTNIDLATLHQSEKGSYHFWKFYFSFPHNINFVLSDFCKWVFFSFFIHTDKIRYRENRELLFSVLYPFGSFVFFFLCFGLLLVNKTFCLVIHFILYSDYIIWIGNSGKLHESTAKK